MQSQERAATPLLDALSAELTLGHGPLLALAAPTRDNARDVSSCEVSAMAHPFVAAIRTRLPYLRRLYREIDELRHQLATAVPVPMVQPPIIPTPQSKGLGLEFRTFLRLLRPHDVPRKNKRRIGGDGDGGYVMLDDFAPVRAAVSLGIGPNVSWDLDMAALGVRIYQFDDSVPGSPKASELFAFQKKRIVANAPRAGEITLSEIMAADTLRHDDNIVIKMDIEGAEWEVLARLSTEEMQRIRQLTVEFHNLREFADAPWRGRAFEAMKNITASHACVHVHGNNFAPFAVIGGIPFPHSFEATFARRVDHEFTPSTASFPTELDRPNHRHRADLYLGQWDY
jgi:FkbM family methyltransferase